jgi:hypothetical protein
MCGLSTRSHSDQSRDAHLEVEPPKRLEGPERFVQNKVAMTRWSHCGCTSKRIIRGKPNALRLG